MSWQPESPVLAGAGTVVQREEDPTVALDALQLMRTAIERAAADAGAPALLAAADMLFVPQGTWSAANPAAVIAPWNPAIRSVVADLGVLQQTLLSRACAMVAAGDADVVIVCGGEAKHRAQQAARAGVQIVDTPAAGEPAQRMVPAAEIITGEEIARGLPVPARQYAMIDTALRSHDGLGRAEHIDVVNSLWSSFSAVAAANPDAWSRQALGSGELARSPLVAWPYTKLHCSQWNVDQAAALIICGAAAAERYGVSRDRWVFAHAGVESNLMVPMTLRAEVHRSPAVAAVGAVLEPRIGCRPADVAHLELYSCFPAAVRVQAAELGIDAGRPLTVTGGMTFGGGPLNNATLQAVAAMARTLRDDPGGLGLVTNVSGMLTKFGASAWSCRPPRQPFAAMDVTSDADRATGRCSLDPDAAGTGTVITYTVAFDQGQPVQGIVLAAMPSGARALATTTEQDMIASMLTEEWCNRSVVVDGPVLAGA